MGEIKYKEIILKASRKKIKESYIRVTIILAADIATETINQNENTTYSMCWKKPAQNTLPYRLSHRSKKKA